MNISLSVENETSMVVQSNESRWLTRYEIIIFCMFIFGLGAMPRVFQTLRNFFAFFQRINQRAAATEDLARATVQLLREPKATNRDSELASVIQQYYMFIKENSHNASLNPLAFINEMQRKGVQPDITIYNALLDASIQTKNFETARQLFTEMCQDKIPCDGKSAGNAGGQGKESGKIVLPDVVTFNIYIKGIIAAKNAGERTGLSMVEELLREMKARDIKPNLVTFNTIVELYSINGCMDAALGYYKSMQKEYGILPDAYTFTSLMKGIKNYENSIEKSNYGGIINEVLSYMRNNLDMVDDLLWNSSIDACCKFKDWDNLRRIHDLLKESGRRLGLVTYGKLITAYGLQMKGESVAELHQCILQSGLQPNEVTFGCLMESYLRCGMGEKVIEIYHDMLKAAEEGKRKDFNVVVYTTVIRAYAKKQDFNSVLDVYSKMKADPQSKPNRIAYNALLDSCVKCERYEKMCEIFSDMVAAGKTKKRDTVEEEKEKGKSTIGQQEDCSNIEPDLITFSTLVKGMCKSGQPGKAIELYHKMKKEDIKMDEVFYNSLLDGIAKSNEFYEEAEKIIVDMKQKGFQFSHYTYSILIKLYARNNQLDKALQLYDEIRASGFAPGIIVYTCFVQVCIKFKKIDKALAIFEDMKKMNVNPDNVFYNMIINGCVFSGKLLPACKILAETITQELILASDIYNNILRNIMSHQKMSVQDKHKYGSLVCNYVLVKKIQVNMDYFNQVKNTYVIVQPPQQQSKYAASGAYSQQMMMTQVPVPQYSTMASSGYYLPASHYGGGYAAQGGNSYYYVPTGASSTTGYPAATSSQTGSMHQHPSHQQYYSTNYVPRGSTHSGYGNYHIGGGSSSSGHFQKGEYYQ